MLHDTYSLGRLDAERDLARRGFAYAYSQAESLSSNVEAKESPEWHFSNGYCSYVRQYAHTLLQKAA